MPQQQAVPSTDPALERAQEEFDEAIQQRTSLRLAQQENPGIVTWEMFVAADDRVWEKAHGLLRATVNGQAEGVTAALRSGNQETYEVTLSCLRGREALGKETLDRLRLAYPPPTGESVLNHATELIRGLVSAGGIDRAHPRADAPSTAAVSAYGDLVVFRQGLSHEEYFELESDSGLLELVFRTPRDPGIIGQAYRAKVGICLETACPAEAQKAGLNP